jgi:hypothetical protein
MYIYVYLDAMYICVGITTTYLLLHIQLFLCILLYRVKSGLLHSPSHKRRVSLYICIYIYVYIYIYKYIRIHTYITIGLKVGCYILLPIKEGYPSVQTPFTLLWTKVL